MRLFCDNYRLHTEPLRVFSHWKSLDIQEYYNKTTFSGPTFEISGREIVGFWAILDFLTEMAHDLKKLSQEELEMYKRLRYTNDDTIKTVSILYETLLFTDATEEKHSKIAQILKELELIHKKSKFFDSDEATAVDLYFYEFYKTLDRKDPKLLSATIFRYIDRMESLKWMRTYNAIEQNFRRDFAPSLPSLANKIENAFGDKIAQLSDFAIMNGLLFKKKVETVENTELTPIAIPFSLYPKKVIKI